MNEATYPNNSGMYPLQDCVLVLVRTIERKTAGGIILPDKQADNHDMASTDATVVAMGPDAHVFWGDEVKPGDTIIIAKYAGNPKRGKDKQLYRLVRCEDVWGKSDGSWDELMETRQSIASQEKSAA